MTKEDLEESDRMICLNLLRIWVDEVVPDYRDIFRKE